jgi:hypothetical protein
MLIMIFDLMSLFSYLHFTFHIELAGRLLKHRRTCFSSPCLASGLMLFTFIYVHIFIAIRQWSELWQDGQYRISGSFSKSEGS